MNIEIDNYERCLLISLLKEHIDINEKLEPCDKMDKHIIGGAIGLSNRMLNKMMWQKAQDVLKGTKENNDDQATSL